MTHWKDVISRVTSLEKENSQSLKGYGVYPDSLNRVGDTLFLMVRDGEGRKLILAGRSALSEEFDGETEIIAGLELKVCELSHKNAALIRKHFPFTTPKSLREAAITVGLGDRLGLATPGHVKLLKQYPAVSPVLSQQSIRELNLTGRTYSNVLDDVTWGVFQEGYRSGFAADGDHLKTADEVKMALDTGFTMITLDCSEHIDNTIADLEAAQVDALYTRLDEDLRNGLEATYLKPADLGQVKISFSLEELKRVALIYIKAVEFAATIYKDILSGYDNVVFELSIDETLTPTSPQAHYFVASELKARNVKVDNLAPRFCGEFQKGIDYIGDIECFKGEFDTHCRIADYFGYKISVHSGSDKFSIFPVVGSMTGGRYHLKTAGTNWLEAVRVIALKNPSLYRRMHNFAVENIDEAKKYYHISAEKSKIPDIKSLADSELPALMDQDDARQYLHITYGLILKAVDEVSGKPEFKEEIYSTLNKYEEDYYHALARHIGRHFETLGISKNG